MCVNFVKVLKGTEWLTNFSFRSFMFDQNSPVIIISVAVLLSALGTTSSAPTSSDSEWWTNPCSRQLRHGRSPTDNQLRIFINKIDNTFFKELGTLYPHAKFRPKVNCLKIGKMMKPIRDAQTASKATRAFYATMVQIAMFMDKLKSIPVNTTSAKFNYAKRNNIYEEAKGNLRLVLCEFNETIIKNEEMNENWQPNLTKVPNTKCLPRFMDLSSAQIMDLDFFNKLRKFINQSIRKFRKLKKKNQTKMNRKHKKRKNKQ